jgi:hypothetical protein
MLIALSRRMAATSCDVCCSWACLDVSLIWSFVLQREGGELMVRFKPVDDGFCCTSEAGRYSICRFVDAINCGVDKDPGGFLVDILERDGMSCISDCLPSRASMCMLL